MLKPLRKFPALSGKHIDLRFTTAYSHYLTQNVRAVTMEGVCFPIKRVDVSTTLHRTGAWTLVLRTLPLASLTQTASKRSLLNTWQVNHWQRTAEWTGAVQPGTHVAPTQTATQGRARMWQLSWTLHGNSNTGVLAASGSCLTRICIGDWRIHQEGRRCGCVDMDTDFEGHNQSHQCRLGQSLKKERMWRQSLLPRSI